MARKRAETKAVHLAAEDKAAVDVEAEERQRIIQQAIARRYRLLTPAPRGPNATPEEIAEREAAWGRG